MDLFVQCSTNNFVALEAAVKEKKKQGVDLTKLMDASGNSLMHVCAQMGSLQCLQVLAKHVPALISQRHTNANVEPLHLAVGAGQTNAVHLLLLAGANPDSPCPDSIVGQMSALCGAISKANMPLISVLLKANATVDTLSLVTAIRFNHLGIVSMLLDHCKVSGISGPLNAQLTTEEAKILQLPAGSTALLTAIRFRLVEMCALLLQAGADIELADGNGRRPLHVAASLDDVQLIQMLLQRSVKVNSTRKSDSWNALHFAAEAGAFRAVNFLLQLGFPVDGCANNLATTLHIACWNKAPAVVDALIMAKANVNHQMTRGWSALAIACKNGDDVTTTALLKAGAHVNPVDQSVPSPLLNAVMADNGNVVTQILRAKANPNIKNKQGASAVFLASSKGLSGIVRALLQYGALPDASPGDTKVTPLMQTCAFNHLECTQLLLMAKADMNSVSKQNMTPMHLMIKNKNARGLSILLTFKANPNALILPQKNSEDQSEQLTPLFACVSYNFAEGCTILLQRGAHANFKQPSTGCTAFHSALSRKYEDCCRALVAATDLKIPNNNGQTVFDTARGESKLEALLTSPHISQPFSSTLTPMPMNMMMSGLQQQPQQQRPQHVQMSSQQTPVFFNLQRQSQQSSGGFNITSFKSSSTSAQ